MRRKDCCDNLDHLDAAFADNGLVEENGGGGGGGGCDGNCVALVLLKQYR